MLTFLKISTVLVALMLGQPTHAGDTLNSLLSALPLGQYGGANQRGDCTVLVELVGEGVSISVIELSPEDGKVQIFPFKPSDEERVSAAEFDDKGVYVEYTSKPNDQTSAAYVRTLSLTDDSLALTEKRKALFSNTKTADCVISGKLSN